MDRFHNPYGEPGVASDAEVRGWPRPRVLRGNSMSDDPFIFEQAPFFAPDGLRDSQLLQSYADVTGALPGGLSLRAVWPRDFCFRLVVDDENVRQKYRRIGRDRRQRYMASLVCRLSRTPCNRPIPVEWDFDT